MNGLRLHHGVKSGGGRLLQSGQQVRVGVQGYLDTGMAQPLGNHYGMNPLLEHQAGMGMPQIMQPNTSKADEHKAKRGKVRNRQVDLYK